MTLGGFNPSKSEAKLFGHKKEVIGFYAYIFPSRPPLGDRK
jgi:hypothetical protein